MVNVLCHIKYDTLCHKVILYIICLFDVHVHTNLYECQSRHLFLKFSFSYILDIIQKSNWESYLNTVYMIIDN